MLHMKGVVPKEGAPFLFPRCSVSICQEMRRRNMSVNVVLPAPTKTELLLSGKSDQDLKRLTSVATFNKTPEPIDLDR